MSSPMVSVQEALKDMVSSLPKDLFEKNTTKATRRLLISIGLVSLGAMMVYWMPWYLLPLGWFFMGTACCGLFSIGYACGRNLYFQNRIINNIVGTICMLPLMYPLEYFKEKSCSTKEQVRDYVVELASSRFWWLSSPFQWVNSNFNLRNFSGRMIISASFIYLFVAIFLPLMTYGLGLWGLFKFYLIPLFVYHLWMSTFLKASCLQFDSDKPTFLQLPKLMEYLTLDFNIGVTLSRIQTASNGIIPAYKWKDAYNLLKKEYKGISEQSFSSLITKVSPAVTKQIQSLTTSGSESTTTETDESVEQTEQPETKKSKFDGKPWYERIYWVTTLFLFGTPLLSLYGILTTPFNAKTYITAFLAYYIAGIGITAGYHRLFSHRSYEASWPVRLVLMLMGTSTFEMSVINWCLDHRAHHRFTDTDKDPYNIKKGFWHAHMGWMLFKRDEEPDADVSDLMADPILAFQHKYYAPMALTLGFGVPTLICGYFWGDWKGGFFIAGIASKVLMMQCTFCINSLAHYLGEATFTDQRTPRDSPITSLVTFGEGYHNFHHEFPYDYRNGVHMSAYDPGKWLIYFLSLFGATYNLKRFPDELFSKGKIQMAEKKIQKEKEALFWGTPLTMLPTYDTEEFKAKTSKENQKWLIINNIVYDIAPFIHKHPGGDRFILDYIGKDATKAFNGIVYNHSVAARNILDTLRVGIYKPNK
ncbi:delta 9 fatty acid desaturase [Heterostelium album PN500]|uniref:Delta 9 fatty acid desaturase n=1 Tax=Heterostelium pallidum (strain ATCC 26659 / Pp 5 / PN500) TaxID=670386 RepID=D3BU44_HETP5|nr:delta 9 fatty acid desaturase [Heterostelium album PN500]EFA75230.1 delta 9 fatty acid desaturase [Heterostelium album PN500]|eukprot:XP_020427364.1 delta 9 fatty acid desaturase [Heterostelium album PN500]